MHSEPVRIATKSLALTSFLSSLLPPTNFSLSPSAASLFCTRHVALQTATTAAGQLPTTSTLSPKPRSLDLLGARHASQTALPSSIALKTVANMHMHSAMTLCSFALVFMSLASPALAGLFVLPTFRVRFDRLLFFRKLGSMFAEPTYLIFTYTESGHCTHGSNHLVSAFAAKCLSAKLINLISLRNHQPGNSFATVGITDCKSLRDIAEQPAARIMSLAVQVSQLFEAAIVAINR